MVGRWCCDSWWTASVDVNPMSTSITHSTFTYSSNGLTRSSSAETVTVYSRFDAPGNYTVTLTATNNSGSDDDERRLYYCC